jgi:hypothetical protein
MEDIRHMYNPGVEQALTKRWATSSDNMYNAAEASSELSLDCGRQLILPPSRESTGDVGHSSEALEIWSQSQWLDCHELQKAKS